MSEEHDIESNDPMEMAWVLLANVGHNQGGWEAQDPEWLDAVVKWRDEEFIPSRSSTWCPASPSEPLGPLSDYKETE